ncbi:3-isopropylmalate dehydrogenase [Methylocystis parvus]|uniref:3-isopropylmalate dehydrogenase n=1 Tax=Methylocystis parvus TaxID=134 RepID=UPI003C74E3E5
MSAYKLLLLPGDGIGPEISAEAEKVIAFLDQAGVAKFEIERGLVGGAAYDAHGVAISEDDMKLAHAADAVLLAAVGGPKWDGVPYAVRPEAGLLRLRKDLALFANLRPAICYPALADASSLKRELVDGLDIMIVRELTGGVYFGEPKEIVTLENGEKRAVDTQVYTTHEIERIGRVAFELARKRKNKVTSSEKANVMRTGYLWREVITALHKREYADVQLEHMLADALAMQLVRWPEAVRRHRHRQSLRRHALGRSGDAHRLARHAALRLARRADATGARKAMYEPCHGSAPDIAGKGIANPIAMIGSLGMAMRYSFDNAKAADAIDAAIANVLAKGLRTIDIKGDAPSSISTAQMGDAIVAELKTIIG